MKKKRRKEKKKKKAEENRRKKKKSRSWGKPNKQHGMWCSSPRSTTILSCCWGAIVIETEKCE